MSSEILSMAYPWLNVLMIVENGKTYGSADCELSVTCLVIFIGIQLSHFVT